MTTARLSSKALFGGAVVCAVPAGFIDASDFRQVPDNQEVYVDPDAELGKDVSLIIELVEAIDCPAETTNAADRIAGTGETGTRGVVAHFNALAEDNGAVSSDIALLATAHVSQGGDVGLLVGTQNVPKYGKLDDVTTVRLALGCIHLNEHGTDVLVTFNAPSGSSYGSESDDTLLDLLRRIVQSFELKDSGLFG